MNPIISWVVLLGVATGVYFYYSTNTHTNRRGHRAASFSTKKRDDGKAPAAATSSDVGSGKEPAKVKKAAKKEPKEPKEKKEKKENVNKFIPLVPETDDASEEDADKDWAKRLVDARKGTTLAPPVRTDSRNRSVKQSKVAQAKEVSAASSTAGDADDDLSPALSPTTSRDVSDMLEPQGSGPSVLRLTESTKPALPKKQKEQRPVQAAESKKQRQNRKKAEERKAQREEEEKERRVLMEKQMRTAREARGEPAKNGVPAKAPANNAWADAGANGIDRAAEAGNGVKAPIPLLDTFDGDRRHSTSSSDAANTHETSATNTSTFWDRDLPSEEEQMRLLQEEVGWNTVPARGRKGKKKSVEEATSDGAVKEVVDTVKEVAPAKGPAKAPIPDVVPVSEGHKFTPEGQDSDWAVC